MNTPKFKKGLEKLAMDSLLSLTPEQAAFIMAMGQSEKEIAEIKADVIAVCERVRKIAATSVKTKLILTLIKYLTTII